MPFAEHAPPIRGACGEIAANKFIDGSFESTNSRGNPLIDRSRPRLISIDLRDETARGRMAAHFRPSSASSRCSLPTSESADAMMPAGTATTAKLHTMTTPVKNRPPAVTGTTSP